MIAKLARSRTFSFMLMYGSLRLDPFKVILRFLHLHKRSENCYYVKASFVYIFYMFLLFFFTNYWVIENHLEDKKINKNCDNRFSKGVNQILVAFFLSDNALAEWWTLFEFAFNKIHAGTLNSYIWNPKNRNIFNLIHSLQRSKHHEDKHNFFF